MDSKLAAEKALGWFELNLPSIEGHEHIEALKTRLSELGAQVPRWIPVTERLPELHEAVLVAGPAVRDVPPELGWSRQYDVTIAWRYEREGQGWQWAMENPDDWVGGQEDVAHWQPLPSPPAMEEGITSEGQG